jgi:hypothetical protein
MKELRLIVVGLSGEKGNAPSKNSKAARRAILPFQAPSEFRSSADFDAISLVLSDLVSDVAAGRISKKNAAAVNRKVNDLLQQAKQRLR